MIFKGRHTREQTRHSEYIQALRMFDKPDCIRVNALPVQFVFDNVFFRRKTEMDLSNQETARFADKGNVQ